MANEMETFAARLATFDLVLHPDRRVSGSKSAEPISWPHSRPSPAELAHAGFFYNPYETNPDNTTCFMCRRALDGWEEEDNPITEHLKHAKDCGWAVMMDIQQRSSNPAEIEDPTSEHIAQARLSTFGESWPHDGKKGWLCQSEKMVEGGWYFCPNEESADLASCAYCKLSLDGWEPKDNPFDEHYRRSSDCSFFVFAKPAKGKGSRSKARTSKASRLSTQSTASEMPASDIEDQMDVSVLSQNTKAKGTKKSSKSKSKTAKSKKDEIQETESHMDVDEADDAQPETSKPKRATRGKKRPSADIHEDAVSVLGGDNLDLPEPPAKKRATKSRTNRAQAQSIASTDEGVEAREYESDANHGEEDLKSSRGTSKKKTSRGRKGSVTSTTSKAVSKSRIPRDSELDAAIEAGLEADEPRNIQPEEVGSEKTTSKPSAKKSKSKKKNAKKDPVPSNDADEPALIEEIHTVAAPEPDQEITESKEVIEQQEPKATEVKGKRRSSNKTKQSEPEVIATIEEKPKAQEVEEDEHHHHDSFVSIEIVSKPPTEYTEIKSSDKDSGKVKKKSTEKPKKSKKADKAEKKVKTEIAERKSQDQQPEALEISEEPLHRVSRTTTPEPPQHEEAEDEPSHRRPSKVPPKTAERYSDIPHEKQFAKSLVESDQSPETTRLSGKQDHDHEAVSPLPSVSRGSPSLSPQSSDAENHPPSLKASAPGTHLTSPSKPPAVRFPLGTSTPSPSKRNASASNLRTSHPWFPINVEEIFLASASDKENAGLPSALGNLKGELASPEKKMTVEEWIMWNAKNGEERLKRECERLVGQFEKEGARAMRTIEGIECID